MALRTIDLGPVSSYAIAVEKGYTGTEAEWYELIHNVTSNAEAAAGSASSAAQSAATAVQAVADVGTAKDAAIAAIQGEGSTQTAAVTAEGAAQIANVQAAEESAVDAVEAQQGTSEQAVYDKGVEQIAAVGAAGTTQIGLVQAEGATQIAAVEAKGEEVIESIPEDYSDLTEEVGSLKSAVTEITEIKSKITYTSGYYIATNSEIGATVALTRQSNASWEYVVLDCNPGDKFKIYAYGAGARAWAFLDSNNVLLAKSEAGLINETVTAPANTAKVVLNNKKSDYTSNSYTVVGTDAFGELETTVEELETAVGNIETILYNEETYGNYAVVDAPFVSGFNNFTACPCKKTEQSGKLTTLYIKSYESGTAKLYVGIVDQLYLFVPRYSFDVAVSAGEQYIDVSGYDYYISEGEQVLIKFVGRTPFKAVTGTPEDDDSFYYSQAGTLQLQVYGAQNSARFGFGYKVDTSELSEQGSKIAENTDNIVATQAEISALNATKNIISDRQGNKYKMVVTNGELSLIPLNFSHVLCVGNSYTVHPTTTDSETDYANNLWWGHWAMAASSKNVAWPKMLQTAIRQKVDDAVVTPVFGRRYETAPSVYTLSNSDTFTYWDGTAWQSLRDNVANFSDVDAVVFFLGINYSGNDWYSLYYPMVQQFITWFPNAEIFCCSTGATSRPAKDSAIQQTANEISATYINMVGINAPSKIGAYVYGDDNNLHQIDNSAVANHFGDYGEYLIHDRICGAMGYANNTALYNIAITNPSGATLTVISDKTVSWAVVSVFADVASGTLASITVKDASNNTISVTDHGATTYGRIFTFVMPTSDVTITGTMS